MINDQFAKKQYAGIMIFRNEVSTILHKLFVVRLKSRLLDSGSQINGTPVL